jgi:hypothetical protein
VYVFYFRILGSNSIRVNLVFNASRAPTSLLNLEPNQPVEVKIAQRMNEDYKEPPKKPMVLFGFDPRPHLLDLDRDWGELCLLQALLF